MPRKKKKHVAELEWLEEGINFLVGYTFQCSKVIVLGCMQLYRQWKR